MKSDASVQSKILENQFQLTSLDLQNLSDLKKFLEKSPLHIRLLCGGIGDQSVLGVWGVRIMTYVVVGRVVWCVCVCVCVCVGVWVGVGGVWCVRSGWGVCGW